MDVRILPSSKNDRFAMELSSILGVRLLDLEVPEKVHDQMVVIDCGPEQAPYDIPIYSRVDIIEVAEIAKSKGYSNTVEAYADLIQRMLGDWWR